jgi:putative FmdB family regulatory protein
LDDPSMALYEYLCPDCGTRTEKRMPMTDVLQMIPCPKCGKQARKTMGSWALVGVSSPGVEDGPAPWDSEGDDGGGGLDDLGGGDFGGHGHSHGPGGHSH